MKSRCLDKAVFAAKTYNRVIHRKTNAFKYMYTSAFIHVYKYIIVSVHLKNNLYKNNKNVIIKMKCWKFYMIVETYYLYKILYGSTYVCI